jgi:hypothetical protein
MRTLTAAVITTTLAVPGMVGAEYTDNTKEAVAKEIVMFYQAENGNKLTEYGIRGLAQRVEAVFEQNKVKEEAPPAPEVPTPPTPSEK